MSLFLCFFENKGLKPWVPQITSVAFISLLSWVRLEARLERWAKRQLRGHLGDETRHSHERQHKCICLSVHRSTDLTSFNDSVSNPEEEVSLFHDGFHLQDCHDPPWRVRVEQTQQVLRMVNRKRKNSVLVEKSPFAGITAGRRDKSLTLGF